MDSFEFINQFDLLQGNINRMRLTDDLKELFEMRNWAQRRIDIIFAHRYERLSKGEDVFSILAEL